MSFKIGNPGCGCGCCSITVNPVDSGNNTIIGATVYLYWNAATQGAYADPSLNDSGAGPYTVTDNGGVTIGVPSIGVFLVKVIASGYGTQYYYTFGCGYSCTNAFPVIAAGSTRTITTNVQTTPFTYGVYNTDITTGNPSTAGWGLPVSGTLSGPPSPTGSTASTVTGGVITLQNPGSTTAGTQNTCVASTGNPGVIAVTCSNFFPVTSSVVNFYTEFMYCPPRTVLYTNQPSSFTPPPSTLTPAGYNAYGLTHFQSNYGTYGAGLLGSTITNIQFSPFKVEGTWNSTYTTTGRDTWSWLTGTGPYTTNSTYVNFSQPGPAYTPLTGTFTIQ